MIFSAAIDKVLLLRTERQRIIGAKHDQITPSTAVSIVIKLLLMRSALTRKPNPLKSSCVDDSVKRDSAFQTPVSGGHLSPKLSKSDSPTTSLLENFNYESTSKSIFRGAEEEDRNEPCPLNHRATFFTRNGVL